MSYKIKINCLKFSSLALFLLFLQPLMAQPNKKNPKEIGIASYTEVDDVVKKYQKGLGNNVVAMLWTDTLVYKHELGEFDAKTIVPIDAASKWLTAALVMRMVDQGKISLDDKVSQYLPIFELYGKNYITIRHCLSHFTGVQNEGLGIESHKKFASLEEEVESFAKKEIKTNPGTEFHYSQIGLNIAGRILEIVTKKKFDMLIKKELFTPLGMRKSSFSRLDGGAINPSGGGQSSAEEYLIFLKMLLNNGKHNGQQFLSEASINELKKIQTTPELIKYAPKFGQGLPYALGSWVVDEGKNGEASALSASALTGSFPMVDWCRGYAFILMVKSPQNEQKKEPYIELKEALDEKLKSKCN
jgi:CubicO group peptidase (beta-lactamase class C family)